MRVKSGLVVSRMTEEQLWARLHEDTYELEHGITTQGEVARRKAIPSEIRAIARELRSRGHQLPLFAADGRR